ncbi:MAG: hypothetical protein E6J34_01840 [Chloroflexi bacterium]|nr:MAG: hypothetical protein E6J34_01840 [Chloroflexota bacterium]
MHDQTPAEQRSPSLAKIGRRLKQIERRPLIWGVIGSVLGMVLGCVGLFLVSSLFMGDKGLVQVPASNGNDAIIVQISAPYLAQMVQKSIQAGGIPGDIKNVQVSFNRNSQMTVAGDNKVNILGFDVTKHFTVLLQPFVQDCQVRVRVLHADLDGIPTTALVSLLEGQIDQQLQAMMSTMPKGFTYCASNVHAERQRLVIIYSATPT